MGRKSGINKLKAGFSVDIDVYDKLEEYCDLKLVNKSRLVNKLLKEFLSKNMVKKIIYNENVEN
jgi:stress-induced morphogen